MLVYVMTVLYKNALNFLAVISLLPYNIYTLLGQLFSAGTAISNAGTSAHFYATTTGSLPSVKKHRARHMIRFKGFTVRLQ